MGIKSNREQPNMKTQTSLPRYVIIIAMFIGATIGMAGCADYVGVDVARGGYDRAYYAPDYQQSSATYYAAGYQPTYAAYYAADYQPVYSGYYYGGAPWWGASYYYSDNDVVVKDVNKYVNVNRNGYFGGRRFAARGVGQRRAIATAQPAARRPAMTRAATTRPVVARPTAMRPAVTQRKVVAPVRR
jgi:hypothetical protein